MACADRSRHKHREPGSSIMLDGQLRADLLAHHADEFCAVSILVDVTRREADPIVTHDDPEVLARHGKTDCHDACACSREGVAEGVDDEFVDSQHDRLREGDRQLDRLGIDLYCYSDGIARHLMQAFAHGSQNGAEVHHALAVMVLQRIMHARDRVDPGGGGSQGFAGGGVGLAAGLHGHQTGHDLKAVLDAVIAFAQHDLVTRGGGARPDKFLAQLDVFAPHRALIDGNAMMAISEIVSHASGFQSHRPPTFISARRRSHAGMRRMVR